MLCGVAETRRSCIGIDEDTAVRVFPDDHFEVIGSNSVTVVDGRGDQQFERIRTDAG